MTELEAAHLLLWPGPIVFRATILGNPGPKQRARRGASGGFYAPDADDEDEIGWALRRAFKRCLDVPFVASMGFYMETRRAVDWDNLVKRVNDAGNEVVWTDDRLNVGGLIVRMLDREAPRTEIVVSLAADDVLAGRRG